MELNKVLIFANENKPIGKYIKITIERNTTMTETRRRLPQRCPACDNEMLVGKMVCPVCDTEVCGSFELLPLIRLTEKEQQFVLDFVKASGSLKDMAKRMGVSYPTVRNILDDLIEKLKQQEK